MLKKVAINDVAVSVWGRCLTEFNGYPGWEFPKILEENGLVLRPLKSGAFSSYIALEHSSKSLNRIRRFVPVNRRFLISLEPRAVTPNQYRSRVRRMYNKVVVQSHLQIYAGQNVVVCPAGLLPSEEILIRDLEVASSTIRAELAIGVVNQNKFSFVRGSRYKLRREYIVKLAKSGYNVNLAGPNWDRGLFWHLYMQFKSLIWLMLVEKTIPDLTKWQFPIPKFGGLKLFGRVADEVSFMRNYDFALVVENDPDYVSEKLFNAIRAGAVPIYVGPDLGTFGIPKAVAICDFVSPAHLLEKLQVSSSAETLKEYRDSGRNWLLNSKTSEAWNHDKGFRDIVSQLAISIYSE